MAFGDLKGTLTGHAGSVTNPSSLTGSVSVAVGDLIVTVFGQQTALTATAAADNLGNTYSAQNAGSDGGAATGRMFYSRVTAAGTLTQIDVTATASANDWAAVAAVFEGPFTVAPLDATPANGTTDVTSPFICPSSGTLAQTHELIIAWGCANHAQAWAATAPNTFAVSENNVTLIKAVIGYQTVTATSAVAPQFTAAANPTNIVLGTASFKRALEPGLVTNSQTFYSPTVASAGVLSVGLVTNSQTFYAPTVEALSRCIISWAEFEGGDYLNIAPPLFTNTQTFHAPMVIQHAVVDVDDPWTAQSGSGAAWGVQSGTSQTWTPQTSAAGSWTEQ